MLIWNRIVRRGEIGFARFGGSRASALSSFSGSVGFSNFVLRVRGLRSRSLVLARAPLMSASRVYRDLACDIT